MSRQEYQSISQEIWDQTGLGNAIPGATPRARIDVRIDIKVPPERGRYALKFDLVSEGIDWFERCGSETTMKPLVVR